MSSRRRVLIIDDEIDLCHLLKGYFLKKDYDVYLSHSLKEGISLVDSLQPDIVFLDNNLPDGTGWDKAPLMATSHPQININLISAFHPTVPKMPTGTKYNVIEKPIKLTDLDQQFIEDSTRSI
jgi:DNA-binding NtrC family response regulator